MKTIGHRIYRLLHEEIGCGPRAFLRDWLFINLQEEEHIPEGAKAVLIGIDTVRSLKLPLPCPFIWFTNPHFTWAYMPIPNQQFREHPMWAVCTSMFLGELYMKANERWL